MSAGKFTFLRVAGAFRFKTGFVLGGEGQRLKLKPGIAQLIQGIFGCKATGGAGRQVKNFCGQALTHGFNCRKNCCHGFANAGCGLDQLLTIVSDSPINIDRHFTLARAIIAKRKLKLANGFITQKLPADNCSRPLQIAGHQVLEKDLEFRQGKVLFEITNFAGIHLEIGQLRVDCLQILIQCVNIGIGF